MFLNILYIRGSMAHEIHSFVPYGMGMSRSHTTWIVWLPAAYGNINTPIVPALTYIEAET